MRRWMAAPLVFAAVALALTGDVPTARAQPPVDETFVTADGVRLKGLFHRSSKPAEGSPVVVLLYAPGAERTMDKPGDWAGLTKTLNDGGFHVFRFDWRGHGKSVDITDPDKFWGNPITGPWNRKHINGAYKKPLKNELNVKTDIKTNYFPAYVNDLAAARMHLDQKNDQGDLNTSSIYLIGAGDAATLGMLWTAAEWFRPAVHPVLGLGQQYELVPTGGIVVNPEAGRDVAGAIWLSAGRPSMIREGTVAGWAKTSLKMRENNPMMFLYGEKELPAAVGHSKFFFNEVLVAKGNKQLGFKELEQTFLVPVANSKLNGVALLGNNKDLGTEDTIMKALAARQKDRVSITRKERKYVGPYYINLGYFGLYP